MGKKEPSQSELKNISIVRKSIHLKNSLKKGSIIQEDDLIPLRPGDGISQWNGRRLLEKNYLWDYTAFQKIQLSDLK